MSETFQEAAEKVAKEMVDLLVSKQKDYGPKNILEFGLIGVLIRTNDKIERLKNLYGVKDGTFREKVAKNESILDTWKDLGNYSIIAQMLINGAFELPMKKTPNSEIGLKCNCERCTGLPVESFYPEDEQKIPEWKCPWCLGTEMWFDRTIYYDTKTETEIGMKDRCTGCGKATDDIPTEEQLKEYKEERERLKKSIDNTDIPF
jgi:hypothetical protein